MSPRIPRSFLTVALALLGGAPLAAAAAELPASGGGFSLRLESEGGSPLSTYAYGGSTYVLGHFGHRYNVRVYNHTGRRAEAVVTVDGRDAISGDVGDFSRQRGYIVPPHGSVLIEGFRRNMSDVAAFRFTNPGDSYSSRRGTPQHVGVVGVALFRERAAPVRRPQPIAVPEPSYPRGDAPSPPPSSPRRGAGGLGTGYGDGPADDAAAKSAPSAGPSRERAEGRSHYDWDEPSQNNLGTRYGENRFSPVVEVPFRRANQGRPDRVLAVYYDDAAGLSARGIAVYPTYSRYPPPPRDPSPFPENRRFAPPPPY